MNFNIISLSGFLHVLSLKSKEARRELFLMICVINKSMISFLIEFVKSEASENTNLQ